MTAARRTAAAQRAADKAAEAQRLADTFTELLTVHRARFSPAQPPIAPPGPSVDAAGVRERYRTAAVKGISRLRRRRRAQARIDADAAADRELTAAATAEREDRAARQAVLDQVWQWLAANDPSVVVSVLEQAFADNDVAAAPVGLDGGEVSLVVVAPDESVVPERMPGTTEAGNLSLRKLGKEARAGYYLQALTGHVLVTVREAFAVAPGLNAARVVVLRRGGINAYGSPHVEPILAARWTRDSLTGIRWDTVDATTITRDTATDLLMNTGRVGDLQALDLAGQEDIAEVVARVDLDELLDGNQPDRG